MVWSDNFATSVLDPTGESYVVSLRFNEAHPFPFLISTSSLLYDLELAHDLGVLLSLIPYDAYDFGQYFWYRNGRPLRDEHRLRLVSASKKSPLILEIVIGTLTATWLFIQILEKVQKISLEQEKLRLEIEMARKANALKDVEIIEKSAVLEQLMERRGASQILIRLGNRFEKSEFQLQSLDVRRAIEDRERNI